MDAHRGLFKYMYTILSCTFDYSFSLWSCISIPTPSNFILMQSAFMLVRLIVVVYWSSYPVLGCEIRNCGTALMFAALEVFTPLQEHHRHILGIWTLSFLKWKKVKWKRGTRGITQRGHFQAHQLYEWHTGKVRIWKMQTNQAPSTFERYRNSGWKTTALKTPLPLIKVVSFEEVSNSSLLQSAPLPKGPAGTGPHKWKWINFHK